ncbi:MAG: M20 family metallopeptidase [Anaerolineales bacterium]|jgi:succinyl-diaminopimelate desuccinylase
MTQKASLIKSLPEDLIIELTSDMVAIPTRNPPGEEKAGAEFILGRFQEWGIEAEMISEPDPERPQVVAWHRGTGGGPTVILNGHIDTVGEGNASEWRYPPFEANRVDDRLYGRGTCDMKGSLAIAMTILKTLNDAGAKFPGTLMFQAVMGEEMDEEGTRTLLKKGYTGDCALVLEPTDLRIGAGTRGVTWHKITLSGPSVHCGLAEPEAPDLMYQFANLLTAFEAYHRDISSRPHHLIPSPGFRVTDVRAGGVHNDIVGRCELVVDRRMIPGETIEQVTEEIRQIVEQVLGNAPEYAYELEFMRWNEPTETALDAPLIKTLAKNIEEIEGIDPEIWGPPYGCDMRNFVYDAAIPTVIFGAGDFRVCHKPDEFVPVGALLTCARIVLGTTIDLLRVV